MLDAYISVTLGFFSISLGEISIHGSKKPGENVTYAEKCS